METYEPPFTITNKMLLLVSSIAVKVEHINNFQGLDSKSHLRKNNRIKSIHSSLAIEANSLTLDAVSKVIEGKLVLGPQKEIQEVVNAYKAYGELSSLNPYSLPDLKRVHGLMEQLLVTDAGTFRRGGEGVFEGEKCIFVAPPAKMVPALMQDLFHWLKKSKGQIHPLILSSIFHYEFVFIHPFSDGNGRLVRLWQTALLLQWKPLFQYLPIESQIKKYQAGYYDAIAQCHKAGNSNFFIEFMLTQIDNTLDELLAQEPSKDSAYGNLQEAQEAYNIKVTSIYLKKLLLAMKAGETYTATDLLQLLGLKSKETLRKNYLNPALEQGVVKMLLPDKPTSRNQQYFKTK